MHLVYAHANILNQILKEQVITPVNKLIPLGLAALILVLFGWFTWRLRAISGIVLVLAVILFMIGGQFVLFKATLHYIDVMGAVASGFFSYMGNIAMKTYFETKQKNYITKQFGRYISPDLVKEIASSEQEIQLGGISKELTIASPRCPNG